MGPETFTLFHVRCLSCNNLLADKNLQYNKLILKNSIEVSLNKLGITRMCCRMHVINPCIFSEGKNPKFPEGSNISVLSKKNKVQD